MLDQVVVSDFQEVKEGCLISDGSGQRFAIKNFIPRFVEDDSYNSSFGEQWNRYRRTQIDRFNGTNLSRDRLLTESGWSPEELSQSRVLEVGCGAGRFTQVLIDLGAEVWSTDYSSAVDACWANNGPHPRLRLLQCDLYSMPFPYQFFDKILCYGVLQHTPDPRKAFMSLVRFLKPGGKLSADVYVKGPWTNRWRSKYWYRPITRRMPPQVLRRIIEWYVPRWVPIDNYLQTIPLARRIIPALVPCWNYTGVLALERQQIIEWAVLDTFDALAAYYDFPQSLPAFKSWFEEAGLRQIEIHAGGTGLVGNAML
jgi:SAM-dependent methyltransferase